MRRKEKGSEKKKERKKRRKKERNPVGGVEDEKEKREGSDKTK